VLRDDDLDLYHRLMSDPQVVRYLYEEVLDEARVRDHFERRRWVGVPTEGNWANLVVECGGRGVGEVGFGLSDATNGTCELGYVFSPEVAGLGLATEAVSALLRYCQELWSPHRFILRMDARNDRSAALARRLGFRLEAHHRENEFVKGEWTDELIFALLASELPVLLTPPRLG
jgi:RimJ/RimL family protein N-acetyltransferase